MYSFLVLGFIPGTNIQITFQIWLRIAGIALVIFGLYYLARQHLSFSFKLAPVYAQTRVPLHATQLHQRVQ